MNFFEEELRKIAKPAYPGAAYVGRACYVRLNDMNRAKLEFVTCGTAGHYQAIQITILNRNDGPIDTLRLRFADIWGKGQNSNFYIEQSGPYVWSCNDKTEWYSYQPNSRDYRQLTDAVCAYLDIFQVQEQTSAQQWQQTM